MKNFNDDNIVLKQGNGIEYIQFKKLLEYGIKHAYTLKDDSIDFSFDQELNFSSYEKLCSVLDIDVKTVVQPVQTHTDCIMCLEEVFPSEKLQDVDGLITNKENIALTSKNADCILFLFYDPIKKVIANVHSGWRGTLQKIAEKTVIKMINSYNCQPENIICCISPSIRVDHFEVEDDVKKLFEEQFAYTGKNEEFIKTGNIVEGIQKYNIDTVLINKILLTELGLKEKNIIDSNLCSVCNKEKIESVRVDKEKAKRATAIIVL